MIQPYSVQELQSVADAIRAQQAEAALQSIDALIAKVTADSKNVIVELPPLFLNQSRWKTYQDCDRLYAWFYHENLEPDRPRKVLEIGTAVHKAMLHAHKHGGTEQAFTESIDVALKSFREGMKRGKIQLAQDEAEIQEGEKTLKVLLPAYYREYKGKGQLWKPLGLELAFCVEVGEGTGVFLVGRIDNLVTFMNNLWLADYKTMGKLDPRDMLKYEIDIQLTAYIYGGTKQLSLDAIAQGKPPVVIRGAIIDGLVKTQIPQFTRQLFTRTIDDLRQFEVEFCMKSWEIAAKRAMAKNDRPTFDALIEKMWDLGQQAGWKVIYPKNTSHCFRYGTCSFFGACSKDTEQERMAFRPRHLDYVDFAQMKREGTYKAWMDPEAVAAHPATDVCPDEECLMCSVRDCPHGEPLHYHHDGCPVCSVEAAKRMQKVAQHVGQDVTLSWVVTEKDPWWPSDPDEQKLPYTVSGRLTAVERNADGHMLATLDEQLHFIPEDRWVKVEVNV